MWVPIACRLVPFDQWLVTSLDDGSKVKQAKLWLLAKCNLVQSTGSHSHRAVSPIVFAPTFHSRDSIDTLDHGYSEDDEFSDNDLPPPIYPHRDPQPPPSSQPPSCPLVDQYTLLSFSTGAILEDEFPLAWYNIRPYELLEMHPLGMLAPLHRDSLPLYIQPYFHAKVRVLRAVWNHKSGRLESPAFDPHSVDNLADTLSTSQKRKTKVDWKARWVVINQGILSLSKDRLSLPPLVHFPLGTMTALRGADALERAYAIDTQPHVVCIKFRPPASGVASPPPSSPSSPITQELKTTHREPFPRIDPASDQSELAHDIGEWVVLDMLDDHAYSSILRILHRQAAHPISSSFVPSSSVITVSDHSILSPAVTSFASYDTIPYPEWRIDTVENARRAGMGDVGKAMAWVLRTEKDLAESPSGDDHRHREEMQYKTQSDVYYGSDDGSDDESEMEWEGWMRDLERQSQVRQHELDEVDRSRQPDVSLLPSPPLSEVSPSGSPRVRSPSLHLVASHQHIGNVIRASGTRCYHSSENPHFPESIQNTTVSTVSVGTPRRRSSTLLADLASTTTRRGQGKQDREPFPSTSLNGTRATGRAISVSAGLHGSPTIHVRHARSSSNLRTSSSPYGSDAAESAGHPGPSSPSKRQSAFMRGMSLRAGKLVRGLESAIDFVDEKTV